MSEENTICPYCRETLAGYEHWVVDDGERVHTHCHMEEEDQTGFDGDFGCS